MAAPQVPALATSPQEDLPYTLLAAAVDTAGNVAQQLLVLALTVPDVTPPSFLGG